MIDERHNDEAVKGGDAGAYSNGDPKLRAPARHPLARVLC